MVEHANALLGYGYELEGVVRPGDQRGRTIGFPTANVHPLARNPVLPGAGVYAVEAGLQRGGRLVWRPAVANLGRRPTFDGRTLLLEVHLLEGGGDLYGQRIRVAFRPASAASASSPASTSSRRRSPATASRPAPSTPPFRLESLPP